MSIDSVQDKKRPINTRKSRRRKKRRTEDFSSSSEDSSDSSDDSKSDDNNDENVSSNEKEQARESDNKADANLVKQSAPKTTVASLGVVVDDETEDGGNSGARSTTVIPLELRRKLNEVNLQRYEARSAINTSVAQGHVNEIAAMKRTFQERSGATLTHQEFLRNFAETHLGGTDAKKVSSDGPSSMIRDSQEGGKKGELLDEYLGLMMGSYDADLDTLRKASDLSEFSLPMLANLLREGGKIFDYESLNSIIHHK